MLSPNTKSIGNAALVEDWPAPFCFISTPHQRLLMLRVCRHQDLRMPRARACFHDRPIFWLIVFGAQVAYAFSESGDYLEEKQIENINQRGRESSRRDDVRGIAFWAPASRRAT